MTRGSLKRLIDGGVKKVTLEVADLEGAYTMQDVADPETGEVLVEANEEITPGVVDRFAEAKATNLEIFFPEANPGGPVISNTLRKDNVSSRKEALVEIYRKMRPGDPPTAESSRNLFSNMFENSQRYDFSRVGRLKFNLKLGNEKDLDDRLLDADDFVGVVRYLLSIPDDPRRVDDIDHLGNRRVRSVGELLENQFRIGPGSHGTRRAREDERASGNRDGNAARPDQRQAGHGGGARVLRFVAAVAVHGPDEPAVRDHPQASLVGSRTGRLVA